MNEPLHPAQLEAVEKLKRLKVGALYIERQRGMLRTVLELIRYRLKRRSVDGVLWLCTRRREERIREGILRHAPELADVIRVVGLESLSHNREKFVGLMEMTEKERMMLVIDNGLLIKNGETLRTRRVLALSERCAYRLLISDVPFTRRISDMYTQWLMLDWRILGYRSYWGFCVNHIRSRNRSANTEYLVRRIEPYCAQILREDVQPTGGKREFVWRFELPEAAMTEYRRVAERFLWGAMYSSTGVYRMLQACQQVACGRRVVEDYPLRTEPIYSNGDENPRLQALLHVLMSFTEQKVLILCRYRHECELVFETLSARFGEAQVGRYSRREPGNSRRLTVMNLLSDELESSRLRAEVILYYSSDWDWRKRQEKEQQCQHALSRGQLTVVNLAAADTIDLKILRSVWKKENLVTQLRRELANHFRKTEQ